MALCFAAGLEGIKQGLKPVDPIDFNIFELEKAERREAGIESLPSSLIEAVKAAEADPFIKETIGEHAYDAYISGKKNEGNEYRQQISQWEIDRYLKK
jgi:glutamine synthetase